MITVVTTIIILAVLTLAFETTRLIGVMLAALLFWIYPMAFLALVAIGGALVYYYRQRR